MFPVLTILGGVGNFKVVPERDDTRPIVVASDFVGLYADQRILSHPGNLLSQRRKGVQALAVEDKIDGDNIGSVIGGAGQSAKAQPLKKLATLSAPHFGDEHLTVTLIPRRA
jgi:hypothetical protein